MAKQMEEVVVGQELETVNDLKQIKAVRLVRSFNSGTGVPNNGLYIGQEYEVDQGRIEEGYVYLKVDRNRPYGYLRSSFKVSSLNE